MLFTRKRNMSNYIEHADALKTLGDLYASWDRFADVPVSEDGAIEAPFLHFRVGVERETIWRWFESKNPQFVVGEVLNGIRHEDSRQAQVTVKSAKETRSVALAETTLTFSLPDDFGMGWEYTNVRLYGQHHAWAGSYDKSESGNFAHEALMQLPEVTSAYLQVGLTCNVDVKVNAIAEAAAIQSRLQAVVDAFAVRPERQICVRGSNFYDSQVTEHDANDPDIEVVSDMPYLRYLAKCVPLAESLPALSGHDLAALRAQADDHQRAEKVVKDDLPSPGV